MYNSLFRIFAVFLYDNNTVAKEEKAIEDYCNGNMGNITSRSGSLLLIQHKNNRW